jgi:hypothetical protein
MNRLQPTPNRRILGRLLAIAALMRDLRMFAESDMDWD